MGKKKSSHLPSEGQSSAQFPLDKEKKSHLQRGRELAEKADNMIQLLTNFKRLQTNARTNQIAAESNIIGGDRELAAENYEMAAEAIRQGAFGFNVTRDVDRAAGLYKQAADTNKNSAGTIGRLEKAANEFKDISKWEEAVACFKDIAEFYESEEEFTLAMGYYGKAASLPQIEQDGDSLIPCCKIKVAKIAVKLEKYDEAANIYLGANKPADAFFFKLAKGNDAQEITDSLKEYEEFNPTFKEAGDYNRIVRIVAAIKAMDSHAFQRAIAHLDPWKKILVSKAKEIVEAEDKEIISISGMSPP